MSSAASASSGTSSMNTVLWFETDDENKKDIRNRLVQSSVFQCDYKQNVKCAYCKKSGHHIDLCIKAFVNRLNSAEDHCQHDRHYPYRHGEDWRCNNCGMHFSFDEAMEQLKSLKGKRFKAAKAALKLNRAPARELRDNPRAS